MQNLILVLTLVLMGAFLPSQAQSDFETEMENALTEFSEAKTSNELERAAQHFDQISKMDTENWLPVYYTIFIRAIDAFSQNKNVAIKKVDELEDLYANLEAMENVDKSELLALRGLFRTVKVAKDPQTYGMSLSGAIIKDYDDALKLNPNNPRAMYLQAQFNMEGAPFWGKDRKNIVRKSRKPKHFLRHKKPKVSFRNGANSKLMKS